MRDKKKQWIVFHMFELDKMCEHFSDMAKQGWMLEKFHINTATYKRCEPCDLNFYISLNRRATTLNIDYVSEDDERFSDFVEEYGLTLISRTSLYQVFVCDHPLPFNFYDTSIQEYVLDRKKQVMRYEYAYHVCNHLALTIQILPLLFPFGIRFLHWADIFRVMIVPFLLVDILVSVMPILLWRIKKENYHAHKESILARSPVILSSIFGIMITVCLNLLFYQHDTIVMYGYLLAMLPFCYYTSRLLFMKFKQSIRYITSSLLTLLCISGLYGCLIYPYHDIPVIDTIAPYHAWNFQQQSPYDFYISNQQSSFLISNYSLTKQYPLDEACLIENTYDTSSYSSLEEYCDRDIHFDYYILKNKFFEDALKDSVLSYWDASFDYKIEDYRIYTAKYNRIMIVKEDKVLVIHQDGFSREEIEQYIDEFKM